MKMSAFLPWLVCLSLAVGANLASAGTVVVEYTGYGSSDSMLGMTDASCAQAALHTTSSWAVTACSTDPLVVGSTVTYTSGGSSVTWPVIEVSGFGASPPSSPASSPTEIAHQAAIEQLQQQMALVAAGTSLGALVPNEDILNAQGVIFGLGLAALALVFGVKKIYALMWPNTESEA